LNRPLLGVGSPQAPTRGITPRSVAVAHPRAVIGRPGPCPVTIALSQQSPPASRATSARLARLVRGAPFAAPLSARWPRLLRSLLLFERQLCGRHVCKAAQTATEAPVMLQMKVGSHDCKSSITAFNNHAAGRRTGAPAIRDVPVVSHHTSDRRSRHARGRH
jgi:hypothetical protein